MLFETEEFIKETILPARKMFEIAPNLTMCSIPHNYKPINVFFQLVEIPKFELQQINYLSRELPKSVI